MRTIGVLDDSAEDWLVLRRLLARHAPDTEVVRFRDGDEALAALRDGAPVAALLVDLNLPLLSGDAFIRAVRADAKLGLLPIVVLSGSNRPEDVDAAYAAGANAYVRKPLDAAAFGEALARLVQWVELLELPGVARRRGASAWT